MGLIELFKEFHSQAVEGRFPASSRALYNFFLGEFNNRFWATEQLTYSERELAELTQIPKSTLRDAVKFLSDRGFIKTYKKKQGTIYVLPLSDRKATTYRPPADQSPTVLPRSNYAHAKDFKTEDTKTQKATATDARGQKFLSVNSSEVVEAWNNANTPALKGNIALSLIELEKEFGTQNLVDAIKAADLANKNPVLSFNFVKKVLANRMKGINSGKPQSDSKHGNIGVAESNDWETKRPSWLD